MVLAELLLLCVTFIGHGTIWVFVFNRLHTTAMPCWSIRILERVVLIMMVAVPAFYLWQFDTIAEIRFAAGRLGPLQLVMLVYLVGCWILAARVIGIWTWRKLTVRRPIELLSNDTCMIDVTKTLGRRPVGSKSTELLSRLPGNGVFNLAVNEKTLTVPRLPSSLDGFSIVHLSDLHFTGKVTKDYFRFVVDQANEMDADLVAVTGDLVDKTELVEWTDDTIGRLRSRFGVYFLLGNHDKRVRDVDAFRAHLTGLGLTDLGTRWLKSEFRGERVLLAGNEVPWFGTHAELESGRPSDDESFALRILLSHSPDQIRWAQAANFDVMLAGHTHGGQIRLPVIGPIISPSNFGVKFASGVFYEAPTLMHVSRGVSGVHSLRINCSPELTKVVLRCR